MIGGDETTGVDTTECAGVGAGDGKGDEANDDDDDGGQETEIGHEAGTVYADSYYTVRDDLPAPVRVNALDQSPQAKEIARLRAELKSLREKH